MASSESGGSTLQVAESDVRVKMEDESKVDVHERDPLKINEDLHLRWEEVFGEPHHTVYSFDGVWKLAHTCYYTTKLWTYRILTLICAVPAACYWGFEFACLACNIIWCLRPALKAFEMQAKIMKLFYSITLSIFLEPLVNTLALCCSRIKVEVVNK